MLFGVPGTKSFWQAEENFFMTGGEQCQGCGSLLGAKLCLRTIYETTKDAMVFGRGCGLGRSELQTGGRIAQDGSGMYGIMAAMKLRGVTNRHLVVMSGDGRTLDMGFGDFCSAFERGQPVTYIIFNNQHYAAAGSHKNATTPFRARTAIFTKGTTVPEKQTALMMAVSSAKYVATATPAYVKDLVSKVQMALLNPPSYVELLVPCQISWRYNPDEAVTLTRLAVQSGWFPLWEVKGGVLKRTVVIPPAQKVPVMEYTSRQGRFEHLEEEDLATIEKHIDEINQVIDGLEGVVLNKQGLAKAAKRK